MRNIRRLPPFLRMVSLLGLLCPLAAMVIYFAQGISFWSVFSHGAVFRQDFRMTILGINLLMFGLICTSTTIVYAKRFELLPPSPLPLDSLRKQALAVMLPAIPMIVATALAFTIPQSSAWFGLAFGVTMIGIIGAIVNLVTRYSLFSEQIYRQRRRT